MDGKTEGRGKEGWSVEEHIWVGSEGPAVVLGHGVRGAVVGWYLRVLVVDEKKLNRNGVRVVVMMRRVAVGKSTGGYGQAVGSRSRKEWFRHNSHKMSRKQLVGITGQKVQASGSREVLVEGQDVWEEWMGQTVEDTEGRRWTKGQCKATEQAAVRRDWTRGMARDKVYDRG